MALNYLTEMSVEDRHRSFEGTWVLARLENERRAVRCEGFYASTITVRLANNNSIMQLPITSLDLVQPDLGMFWWKGSLYYAMRNIERQWRRGFRMRNIVVYKLGPQGKVEIVHSPELERHVVLHFFEGGLAHDNVLSKDFGRRGNLLFFRNIPVGEVKGDVITLHYDVTLTLEGYTVCRA
jgi:hypothetical protein